MNDFEVLRIIKLVERTHLAFDKLLPIQDDRPLWNAAAHLISSECANKTVTVTSLGSVIGLPYATSRRFTKSLIAKGFIIKSPRSASGKSYSLHPSESLKEAFRLYAKEIKTIFAETVGARRLGDQEDEYYFGAPPAATVEPPVSLREIGSTPSELKFLVNDDPYFAALRNMWTDFRSNLGSQSSFTAASSPDLRDELIRNAQREISRYDVVSVNLPWIGELVERKVLQPIADLLDQSQNVSSVADADLKALGQWRGQTYGVPIYCSANLFAARGDLFSEAGLKLPSTFDEVTAAGRALSRPSQGRYGIVWDAAPGMPIASAFMTLMAAAGGPPLSPRDRNALSRRNYGDEELAEIVESDAAARTLDYMHRLVEISPPGILNMAWDQSLEVFMSGNAAMSYLWSTRAARLEYDGRSVVKRRVRYLPQPVAFGGSRASPLSGFLLAVPANLPRERSRLATEAIAWLISTESGRAYTQTMLPVAPRFAVSADPEMKAGSPVIRFIQQQAQKGLLHTAHRPNTAHFTRIEAILGDEIHAAMRKEKSDRAALATAALRIKALARDTDFFPRCRSDEREENLQAAGGVCSVGTGIG